MNILQSAFTDTDPKSVIIQLSHHYLFALFGSAHVKAARKMSIKLTPVVNIINILQAAFVLISFCQKVTKLNPN
jgi:hypothetical protein